MSCQLQAPSGMFTTVTVTRPTAGSYVDGRWVAGSSSQLSITASIQQFRPRPDELLHLPEGDRTREAVRIYTDTELRTANESTGVPADFLTWAGEQWEVMRVETWALGIEHYRAIAMRVSRQ